MGKRWTREEKLEVEKYYCSGHTEVETAEHFGRTRYSIQNFVKNNGLSNGRPFRSAENSYKGSLASGAKERQQAIDRLTKRLLEIGFEYVSGYKNRQSKILIRCKTCGKKRTITAQFIRYGNVPLCHECEYQKTLVREEERKWEDIWKTAQKAIEKSRRIEQEKVECEKEREKMLNEKSHVCKVCGKHFSIAEYMDSCGLVEVQWNPSYCSAECRRKANNAKSSECRKRYRRKYGHIGSHRSRARKFGCEYDPSVNLKKLIERDGLRCAICGGMCNPNDRSWNKNMGAFSPTIDHIIPMSKGGGHTWDNVQVAHAICNSRKAAKIIKEVGA